MTDNQKQVQSVFGAKVAERVKLGGNVSWGGDDSVATIEALADAAYSLDEGFDLIRGYVSELVNPSAFAQKLEKLPEGSACHITRPKRERGKGSDAMAGLAGM